MENDNYSLPNCWLKVSMYPHLVGNVIISVNTGFLRFPL
jgi:hypothetical protein